ncbi:MAG: hypothetical protein AAF211_19970 [Myxococcota bacterium]
MVLALVIACTTTTDDAEVPTGETGAPAPVEPSIPTNDIAGWIATGAYLDWTAEPEIHPSDGPHFGDVLTYFSPSLEASLEAGDDPHPEGAATVKELYGRNGGEVLGHAVMVRVNDREGDRAWYWYEDFEGDIFADGRGVSLCSGCHAAGVDFVISTP